MQWTYLVTHTRSCHAHCSSAVSGAQEQDALPSMPSPSTPKTCSPCASAKISMSTSTLLMPTPCLIQLFCLDPLKDMTHCSGRRALIRAWSSQAKLSCHNKHQLRRSPCAIVSGYKPFTTDTPVFSVSSVVNLDGQRRVVHESW